MKLPVTEGVTGQGEKLSVTSTSDFDHELNVQLTVPHNDPRLKKISEKIVGSVEKRRADNSNPQQGVDDDGITALLQSLLTANQHQAAPLPVKGYSLNDGEQKLGMTRLQSTDATVGHIQPANLLLLPPFTDKSSQAGQVQQLPTAQMQPQPAETVEKRETPNMTVKPSESIPLNTILQSSVNGSAASVSSSMVLDGTDQNIRLTVPELKLANKNSCWAEQLHSALGDRLQLQIQNQIQHATIRLDPPNMGKIDISMQVDNGRLQIHINASHGDVYRALQQVSNELRQTLADKNFIQVNVQVSSQHPGQPSHQEGRQKNFTGQQEQISASTEREDTGRSSSDKDDESIILTV
ncbi:flagellar hook-length control protein FliK [Enterobacter ludwigii]|uniref:flagellar hook-length control protein FliK n=1 Tax=Enterobacter ludwigii TaxID=299767 RepID=UPI003F718A1E